jgi:hypothetical protein
MPFLDLSPEQRRRLDETLRGAHLARLFPGAPGLTRLVQMLEDFFDAYDVRADSFPHGVQLPPQVNIDSFLAEGERNPHRVRVLLQALAFLCSKDMLAMMWMVALGASISRLQYRYELEQVSELVIHVKLPGTNAEQEFTSRRIWDAAILRFAAIAMINDELPRLDGFYPLYIPEPTGNGI